MAKKYAKLQSVENDHSITWTQDSAFLFSLQKGLLHALHEQGMLTKIQLEKAEEILLCKIRKLS